MVKVHHRPAAVISKKIAVNMPLFRSNGKATVML